MKTTDLGRYGSSRTPGTKPDVQTLIGANAQEVVGLVRSYSESQVESWRKVPWLALQAYGRAGAYSKWHRNAYIHGLWMLPVSGLLSNRAVHVDCATGKLVGWDLSPLEDKFILMVGTELNDLDASGIVSELRKIISRAEEPATDSCCQWRVAQAAIYDLKEVYERTRDPDWRKLLD